MELSARLAMNAELVPENSRVADIGCDHGYVSIYLAREKNCRCLAMDVNRGPLQAAGRNIRAAGFEEEIRCRLSDGLSALRPGEVDTLLIAGMGGMLICKILSDHPDILAGIGILVLQPQSDVPKVRKTLHSLGYYIQRESCCVDHGKFYLAVRALCGREETPYTEMEYEYGRVLLSEGNPLYREYLISERKKMQQILCRLKSVRRESSMQHRAGGVLTRVAELEHRIERIRDILGDGADL